MTFPYEILVIAAMLLINAIFAAYEMALASISRARLSTLCQQKKRGAEDAAFMKDRMEASLAVVQLGITLAGAVAAATGGAGAQESVTPFFLKLGIPGFAAEIISLLCVVLPLSAFIIIFAELVPKMFALNNREGVCLFLSPLMKALAMLANPLVSSFETIVKKIMGLGWGRSKKDLVTTNDMQSLYELKAAAALARTSRLIGAHEEKIVLAAAQLSQRQVTEIMLPAADISQISAESSLTEAFIKAHMDMHTRFPVSEKGGDPQTITSYVNFKDIVSALKLNPENPSLQGIKRPIKRLSAETPLSQALSELIRERVHIAIIISNVGEVLGMITLEDIIEELVGEIEDEFDRLPTHVHPCGAGWIMGGGVAMKTVAATLGLELAFEDRRDRPLTLAEWIDLKLGKTVVGGEVMSFDNISVTVRKLRRKKLSEALVSKI